MTLALLITAVGGAWAQDPKVYDSGEVELSSLQVGDILLPGVTLTSNNPAGANLISKRYTKDGVISQYANSISSIPFSIGENGLITVKLAGDGPYNCMPITKDGQAGNAWEVTNVFAESDYKTILIGGTTYVDPNTVEVTTNAASKQDLFTEASFKMPAFDATVNYTLVRDMQDEANPVAFSGLPTNDEPIVVKKGDDGKYQPAEALTIQLIDPLAAAEAQNIIAADGITVKVLVGDGGTPIEYDQENPITLEAFLADMKPGYYWIKAESTDENSPYDGTVYSSEFTVVEKYDLTVKPANDFSKNGLDAVTVGSQSVTIDANTGKATKTGIAPDTEVKIKAKRGYIIEKVEAKKTVPATPSTLAESTVGMIIGSNGKAYAADDKDNLPSGVTAVAKVCYVDGNGHGLALALTDEGAMNWSTAVSTAAAHTPAITGGTWKLATKDEWDNMISAAGSHTALRDGFSSVGGTNLLTNVYWSSTDYEVTSEAASNYSFSDGRWYADYKDDERRYVRACLAF